jgi:hypothetical protein
VSADPSPSVTLTNSSSSLTINLSGGVLSDFHLRGSAANPLKGLGHFLCLDRWGPPSPVEEKNGMPFHGEASKVTWAMARPEEPGSPTRGLLMDADLPLAGLSVSRTLRLEKDTALVVVRERVTNRNKLGRIFNMVQHPTIGPPFLDEETRVDASAGRGLMQSSPLPDPERPEIRWPGALLEGKRVDLRRLTTEPNPNVCSFVVAGELGWTTACAPKQHLLLGYVWPRADYPWFSAWRAVENGKPSFRGLEFGTTGLHQPFPALVKKGRIFDMPLYTYLDAGESATRSYAAFLVRIPDGFEGVGSLKQEDGKLVLRERGGSGRCLTVPAATLF